MSSDLTNKSCANTKNKQNVVHIDLICSLLSHKYKQYYKTISCHYSS